MGLYEKHVLPHVINLCCGLEPIMRQRQKVVPLATGRVLEVGLGTGLNLPFYNADAVDHIYGLEPSPDMRKRAQKAVDAAAVPVELIDLHGEEIPLDDHSVDTVVMTYTLCTIPQTEIALRQMARVLKPGGRLLFCEHGAAPDAAVRKWQDRVNPYWRKIGGGCNLNRAIPDLIAQGGFTVSGLETLYLPGWRPATYNYWGAATPR